METLPFELRSLPDGGVRRLYLVQLPYRTVRLKAVPEPVTIARSEGAGLEATDALVTAIMPKGQDPKAFLDQGGSVGVSEQAALRLGLSFIATNSMRSAARVKAIVEAIGSWSEEKTTYWLNEIVHDKTGNAIAACRKLITGKD